MVTIFRKRNSYILIACIMYMLTMESELQNCRGKDTFESRLSFRKCVKNSTDTDQLDEYLIYVRIKKQNVGTRKT